MTVTCQTTVGRIVVPAAARTTNARTPRRERLVRAQAGLATLAGASAVSALAIVTLLPHL